MKTKFIMRLVSAALVLGLAHSTLAIETGKNVPDIQVKSLKNFSKPEIKLSALKGKVVYVDFWASWCGPCRRSFPVLDKLHKLYKPLGFEVVGINLDENTKDADKFLQKYPVGFPLAADPKGVSASKFNIKGMPSAYLIDKKGVVRHVLVGFKEKEAQSLEAHIKQLLGE